MLQHDPLSNRQSRDHRRGCCRFSLQSDKAAAAQRSSTRRVPHKQSVGCAMGTSVVSLYSAMLDISGMPPPTLKTLTMRICGAGIGHRVVGFVYTFARASL